MVWEKNRVSQAQFSLLIELLIFVNLQIDWGHYENIPARYSKPV